MKKIFNIVETLFVFAESVILYIAGISWERWEYWVLSLLFVFFGVIAETTGWIEGVEESHDEQSATSNVRKEN